MEMTLDFAIQHCHDDATAIRRRGECSCADEHEQLAGWLEELEAYHSTNLAPPDIAGLKAELGNRWIPVSERLPEHITNKVIVLCKNGYVGLGHYEKFNGTGIWYNLESGKSFSEWGLEGCETYEVTHWRTLPEPLKGE